MLRAPLVRLLLAASIAAGAIAACGAPSRPIPLAAGVRLWEAEDHTSEGEVVIAGEPADVYAALGSYPRWAEIFSDVARVEDQGADGDEEKVRLVTTAGQNNNLRFHNDPAHRVVRFRDTGGSADVWAEIGFELGPRPGTTRVHARLHADVHGVLSIFVSDGKLRDQRHAKLASDLADIERFSRPRP